MDIPYGFDTELRMMGADQTALRHQYQATQALVAAHEKELVFLSLTVMLLSISQICLLVAYYKKEPNVRME